MCVLFGLFFYELYSLDLHIKIRLALVNLQWNVCKNRIENQTSSKFMGMGSACLLIS